MRRKSLLGRIKVLLLLDTLLAELEDGAHDVRMLEARVRYGDRGRQAGRQQRQWRQSGRRMTRLQERRDESVVGRRPRRR